LENAKLLEGLPAEHNVSEVLTVGIGGDPKLPLGDRIFVRADWIKSERASVGVSYGSNRLQMAHNIAGRFQY
jgi:hypothetical protein